MVKARRPVRIVAGEVVPPAAAVCDRQAGTDQPTTKEEAMKVKLDLGFEWEWTKERRRLTAYLRSVLKL